MASFVPSAIAIGLTVFVKACCCGGLSGPPYPSPGAPGHIDGDVLFSSAAQPGPATVYAVEERYGYKYRFLQARVTATSTHYSFEVPPGVYLVVARLDSDLTGGGGYASANDLLVPVRVEAGTSVDTVDVGDWTSADALRVLWGIDTVGSPVPRDPMAGPVYRAPPARAVPPPADTILALPPMYVSSRLGVPVPPLWKALKPPRQFEIAAVYAVSEDVRSPFALDGSGLMVALNEYFNGPCPMPDWTLTTSQAQIAWGDAASTFYFEDATPDASAQPFRGYSLEGFRQIGYYCEEVRFTARTQAARESNLPLFVEMLAQSKFRPTE